VVHVVNEQVHTDHKKVEINHRLANKKALNYLPLSTSLFFMYPHQKRSFVTSKNKYLTFSNDKLSAL
jgi:endoglucanase Acf2